MCRLLVLILSACIAHGSQKPVSSVQELITRAQKKKNKDLLDIVTTIIDIQNIIRAYLTEWKIVFDEKKIKAIVARAIFSPDSTKIAILYQHNIFEHTFLRIFDLNTQAFVILTGLRNEYITVHERLTTNVSYAPNGSELAIAAGKVKTWDTCTGYLLKTLAPDNNNSMQHVCYSPDGQYLAIGGFQSALYNAQNYTPLATNLRLEYATTIRFSRDSSLVAFTDNSDENISIFTCKTGTLLKIITRLNKWDNILFSEDNKRLIVGMDRFSQENALVFDITSGEQVASLAHVPAHVNTHKKIEYLIETPNYKMAASAVTSSPSDNLFRSHIYIWNLESNTLLKIISADGCFDKIAFSQNGKFLAGADHSKNILIWDVLTGNVIEHVQLEDTSVTRDITFSPDIKTIVLHKPFRVLQAICPDTSY